MLKVKDTEIYTMSFYQPSLSLYDVLNALSNQGQARSPQDQLYQLQRRQAEAEAQRRAERATARRFPLYSRFDGPPAGYYYRGIPGEQFYYRPDYYQYSDEEGDAEEYSGSEEDEYRQQVPQGETPYLRAAHHHHRGQSDPLQDLLSALLGGAPPGERADEGKQNIKQSVQREELNEAKGAAEPEAEAPVDETKNEQQKPEPDTQPAGKKKPASRSRSFVSNPLQVSKPETRLDLPFSPEANVYDCPNAYVVVVALPGATSKAFKVDYHPSSHELIIKGSISDKLNVDEKFLKISELRHGAFQRTVKFPVLPRIKDEEIRATYNNGLLQVKVPKIRDGSEKPAPKKRIVIEEIPDEELEFEENPNPVQE
ncbi:hypothetical protein HG536_0C00860 [Torulaspora globosa]|uniref:SHSP domain-containing protein n=1 Tax=Torulaspora globosa TaxID=48254 RepID=A0A7G3ZEI3_9SACH|nr:uncharacterized protein HG536_0C00860 [Torulaspora globosa]QLL31919.1 hypothetical protein HG536_0C00860 [Torulaspora globosa]